MPYDKQSNGRRMAVESKSTRGCKHRAPRVRSCTVYMPVRYGYEQVQPVPSVYVLTPLLRGGGILLREVAASPAERLASAFSRSTHVRENTWLQKLCYKSLHGLTPPYLADDCILASSDKFRRRLCSADVDTCIVPGTSTRFGDRSFSAAGPRIWNSLPPDLRRPDIELGEFRRLLKTFLFV